MRIGYFGGSFDPPHRGHLAVAIAAAEAFRLDSVLFVPTGLQPLKPRGPVAPYADRLAMVQLLCAEGSPAARLKAARFQASTLEAPLADGKPNYTVDTLRRLRSELLPADEVFVLAGADAFLQLPQWHDPEQLLALAQWIIVSRPGFDLARLDELKLTPSQARRVHLLTTVDDPTSATELRRLLAGRHPTKMGLLVGLPAAVLAYIQQHQLYGGRPR